MDNNVLLIILAVCVGTLALGIVYIFSQKKKYDKLKLKQEEEIKNLREKLEIAEKIATIDALTGIYNRRRINELLEQELNRAKRHKHQMQVIFMDVDNFKIVNDHHGHDIGDIVLRNIAKILIDNLRNFDIFGRFGGDEFVIILPETTKSHANVVAEKISLNIKKMAKRSITTTMVGASLGISSFDPTDQKNKHITASDLLKKADVKMYEQKKLAKKGV